jgi:hypothetical protein
MDAISLYARSSPWEGSSESTFFLDFEREALPGGDQDRLAALLCGLMHYAERRGLSFPDALAAARQDYSRQRTAYLPGQAVRRAGPQGHAAASSEAPVTGEVIAARPGRPAQYRVDFITSRQWLPEQALEPAQPFPAITTSYGTFSSAYVACHCLRKTVSAIEDRYLDDRTQDGRDAKDLATILTALSAWSGLERDSLLSSFSEWITERNGQLVAGHSIGRPVTLAATCAPLPPLAAPGQADAPGVTAAALPSRKPGRQAHRGHR